MDARSILETLGSLSDGVLYPLFFVMALVENLFPPFPGDAITVFGGYLAGRGRLSLLPAFIAVTAGSWAGFMIYYALGRWLGRSRVHARLERWISLERLTRVETWFRNYGQWVVLANRFLSGARSVISLAAGFARMPARTVALLALASCLAWNALLMGAGYAIGEKWEGVLRFISAYNGVIISLLAVAAAVWVVRRWRGRMG